MGDSRKKTDRANLRAQVIPREIRGIISFADGSGNHPFLVWDVSETGLGIWSTESLKAGDMVNLMIGQPFRLHVSCVVMWAERRGNDEGFRAGVHLLNNKKIPKEIYEQFLNTKQDATG